jgi:hypothetical protein
MKHLYNCLFLVAALISVSAAVHVTPKVRKHPPYRRRTLSRPVMTLYSLQTLDSSAAYPSKGVDIERNFFGYGTAG